MKSGNARHPLARLLGALQAALAAAVLASAASAGETTQKFAEGELLVGLSARLPGFAPADPMRAADGVGQVISYEPALRVARIRVRPDLTLARAAQTLRLRSGVRYVEPNYIRRIAATPDDPRYTAFQWAPQQVQADAAWDLWVPRAQRVIAIVDTGVDYSHPDLAGVIYRDNNGDPVGYNAQNPYSPPTDDHGHGTHVAGIAAAHINNGQGIAGIAGWNPAYQGSDTYVRIMPVRVLNASGSGTDADVAAGITWAVKNGASVINLSLGAASESTTLNAAVAFAINNNVVVVAAAGNTGTDTLYYPAACPDVISVAATDSTDTLASFSNYGSWVKMAAPGVGIHSTYRSSSYADMSGTSMAAPHVAGAAALIRASFPRYSNAQVSAFLVNNTNPYVLYGGRALATGAGRLNVHKALLEASDGLVSLTFSPASVTGGHEFTGTVTIGSAAPAGGKVIALSSASSRVTLPASVTVPEGATSASFTASTRSVPEIQTAVINAGSEEYSIESALILLPPVVADFWARPASVTGGSSSTATVTLNSPAPEGGLTAQIEVDSAAASVPASVTVPEGELTAEFEIATVPVADTTPATITVTTGATNRTAVLNVAPPAPDSITFDPSTVGAGFSATGTVALKGPAAAGGVTVMLQSDTPYAVVPASVIVPEGETEVDFTVQTSNQPSSTASLISDVIATVMATANGDSVSRTLDVVPVLRSVAINPTSCVGGKTSTGTVMLRIPAPDGGVTVNLSTGNPAASVPLNVTVPAGETTATFTISTVPVSETTRGRINASFGGITKQTVTLTVIPPAMSSVTFKPTLVAGGKTATCTVTLNGAAPAGLKATLTTSDPQAAPVPASVTFAAGATTATFTVTGGVVEADTLVTISAKVPNAAAKSGTLTVVPPPAAVASITYSPFSVLGGESATGTVTLTKAATGNGVTVTLTSGHAAATVPASVKVLAGATSATFTITTKPVAERTRGQFTATTSGISKQSSTFTVRPPAFSHITFSPTLVSTGGTAIGKVWLNSKAPAGYTITLTSSNSTAAPVPATVTFAANATTATFTVTGGPVAARTAVSVTGKDPQGISRTSVLDVKP